MLAWGLFALALGEVVVAMVGSVATGLGFDEAVQGFVVTNSAMGLAFPVCGVLLAWQRPRNPIGWLFLADGLGHATTAAVVPLLVLGLEAGWSPLQLGRLATLAAYAWPWSIGLFLPLALLLFPDGPPPGPRWRWLVWIPVVTAPLFVLSIGAVPEPFVPGHPETTPLLTLALFQEGLAPLVTAAEVGNLIAYAAAVAGLLVRYRRGDGVLREQLLWLLLAAVVVTVVLVPWGLLGLGPVLILLVIPAVPAAVTVAILLRHRDPRPGELAALRRGATSSWTSAWSHRVPCCTGCSASPRPERGWGSSRSATPWCASGSGREPPRSPRSWSRWPSTPRG